MNTVEQLVKRVQELVGDQYQVKVSPVQKSDGCVCDMLYIKHDKSTITQRIRVDSIISAIEFGGYTVDEAVENLIEPYLQNGVKALIDGKTYGLSRDFILANVVYRVVEYKSNMGELEDIPHFIYLNLAVLYYCNLPNINEGQLNFRVSKGIMDAACISEEELDKAARRNTLEQSGFLTMSVELVMALLSEGKNPWGVAGIVKHSDPGRNMHVIVNKSGLYGSNVLLYPEYFKQIAAEMDDDLYILPSSLHEVIILPADSISVKVLIEMVQTVNRENVPPEEVLANCVYRYSREKNGIMLMQEA